MNAKTFILSGLAGGIVNYLTGWLFYDVIFAEQFQSDSGELNMLFILFGCLTGGWMLAYIFQKWASISTLKSGLAAGAMLGLFLGLWSNFFKNDHTLDPDYALMLLDTALSVVMTSLSGAAVGITANMLKS